MNIFSEIEKAIIQAPVWDEFLETVAKNVKNEIKKSTPVDTGLLKASARVEKGPNKSLNVISGARLRKDGTARSTNKSRFYPNRSSPYYAKTVNEDKRYRGYRYFSKNVTDVKLANQVERALNTRRKDIKSQIYFRMKYLLRSIRRIG